MRILLLILSGMFLSQGHGSSPLPVPFFEASDLTPYWETESGIESNSAHPIPATVPAFKVLDQDGKVVTEKAFEGKLSLVNFFFARCGSLCPRLMDEIKKTQKGLKKQGLSSKVRIYSFSVTPEQDTSEVLRNYAKSRQIDLDGWSLLTGERSEIYRIGKNVFKADKSVGGQKSDSSFIHSEDVYLLDSKRRIRGIYSTSNAEKMKSLIEDMQKLLKGSDAM